MKRGIVLIFIKGPKTTGWHIGCLRAAVHAAKENSSLPVCLCSDESIKDEFESIADKYYLAPRGTSANELRILMSDWVPFDAWLYVDYDARIIGDKISFGFSVLERGFDFAVCGINCEADKSCFGDSARFGDIIKSRPDIPPFSFYPQLGVSFQCRSPSSRVFEQKWLQTHRDLQPMSAMLQPSFAVTYHDFGHRFKLYHLPPHFNCRKGFREVKDGVELPKTLFPRNSIQILHDKEWFE